ncbi:MAG TPA: hypothetical protein VGR70_11810 [Stellaceae bacterium]|nr:hypothetical protein [Stellaceae bacterium]
MRSPAKVGCYRHCRAAAAAGAVIALVLLSACSGGWNPFAKKSQPTAAPACPVAAILRPLANTVLFAPGAEQKPLYVAWTGIFSDITATCRLEGDILHASLDNVIIGERGPAGRSNDADFNYFVALTAADQTILGKKLFSVHVTLAPDAKRAGVTDHVEVAFSTGGRALSDLNLMVGFQLTPDAVQFYKNYRGRQ